MAIRDRLIKNHLRSMEELKKNLPKAYWPIEGVTQIIYGLFKRKTIKPEEIENYRKRQN